MLLQDDVASCFEYYADLAEKLDKRQGEALQLPMEEFKGAIRREAMGEVVSMASHKLLANVHTQPLTSQSSLPTKLKHSMACRRSRPDHSLELSHADGCGELQPKPTKCALRLDVLHCSSPPRHKPYCHVLAGSSRMHSLASNEHV